MTKIVWMVDGISIVSADELRAAEVKQLSDHVEAWVQRFERGKQAAARTRSRIKQQIDHAFMAGEPVSKFITCDKCDGPATHLAVSQPLRGADILDEELIIGAFCCSKVRRNGDEMIPTASLEFFYTNVRSIGVKRSQEPMIVCKDCECCQEAF